MRWRRGDFRADLYYRLNVFDIRIPPLRERRDDILPLAAGFLREFAGATAELTPEAMEALRRHEWPGNVRELRNVLERALIMCDGPVIDAEHLCLRARKDVPLSSTTDLETLEKHAIERAMREADGNKVRAAKQLGISRMQLYTRLRKFGLPSAVIRWLRPATASTNTTNRLERNPTLASSSASHRDRPRLLDRTACRTIRDIRAREFERPPAVVAAAGVELRGMIREGEPVSRKKLIEANTCGVELCLSLVNLSCANSTSARRH